MTRHLPGGAVAAKLERCRPGVLPDHRPDPVRPWEILLKRVDEPERNGPGRHPDADARHVTVDPHEPAGPGFPLDEQADLLPGLRDAHEVTGAEHGLPV